MLFSKKKKASKKKVIFNIDEDERFYRSVSGELDAEDVYEKLEYMYEHYGQFLVTDVSDSHIETTTIDTVKNEMANKRIEDLEEIINSHVKGRATIGSKVYAVISDGETVGLFNQWVSASFKRIALVREGLTEDEIEIKEFYIE